MPWMIVGASHAGTKLKLNGRLEEGFEHYRRAIAACPAYAPAFYNIGVIHSERRDFAAAKQYYERALQVPISANLQPVCPCHALQRVSRGTASMEDTVLSCEPAKNRPL